MAPSRYCSGESAHTGDCGVDGSIYNLTNLKEVSIVSTDLVSITNDFQAFHLSDWVVAAHLLIFAGIVWFLKHGKWSE